MLTRAQFASLAKRQGVNYWIAIDLRADELGTDGCSGPASFLQLYRRACHEHDVHYRTGQTLSGQDISRDQADVLLSIRVWQMAADGVGWHPASWRHLGGFAVSVWRYPAVRLFAAGSWRGQPEYAPTYLDPQVQAP